MSPVTVLLVAVVVVIVLVSAGGAVRDKLRPTAAESHAQAGAELERRLGGLTDPELRDLFVRLAYGPTESQKALAAALDPTEDVPEG